MESMSNKFDVFEEECNNSICKNKATLMCNRCYDGYCSVDCQKEDWRRHKRFCQPMPLLLPYDSFRSNEKHMLAEKEPLWKECSTLKDVMLTAAALPSLCMTSKIAENEQEEAESVGLILKEEDELSMESEAPTDSKPISFGENAETAQTQGKASSITAMATIGVKHEGATNSQGNSPLKPTKFVAALPPLLFGKKAAETQGKATLITAMPTIGEKHEGATDSQGNSPLKTAKPVAATPPTVFAKEAVHTQGKATLITAMPTIAGATDSQGNSPLKPTKTGAAALPILFGKKAAQLQEKTALITSELNDSLKSGICEKLDEVTTTRKATPLAASAHSIGKPLTKTQEWKTSYESEFLNFVPFLIQSVSKNNPRIIWIMEESNLPHLEALNDHMEEYISEKHQKCQENTIAEGMLFIGFVAGKLYRVKVIQNSVQQKNVLVQTIDYGRKRFIDYGNLYKASAQAAGMKALAFPVEIQGKTYGLIKPEARIHLRLIDLTKSWMKGEVGGVGGMLKAEIQYEPVDKIMQLVALNNYEIRILKISNDGQSALVQCPYKLEAITVDLTKAMQSADFKTFTQTEETLLVAAYTADGWRRAIIIDSLPGGELHLTYLIDEGCLKVSDTIQCLPDTFADFPSFAFAITLKGGKGELGKFQINDQFATFELLYESEKKLMLYFNANKIGAVYLKSYFDDPEFCSQLAIKEINAAGSIVYITKVINHAQVCINLADGKKYAGLFDLLAPKCSKYMDERPTVQDIVLVKSIEGDFYRGEIILLSSENGDYYDVMDVDTGNIHKSVHLDTMLKPCTFVRYLPRHLQELNLSMLHTVPAETLPSSSAILHQLNEYIQEGTQFKVEYSGNSFTEGNLLFLNKRGRDLSTELLPLLNQHAKEELTSSSAPATDSDETTNDTLTNANVNDSANPVDDDDGIQNEIPKECKTVQLNEDVFKSLPPSPPDSPEPENKKTDNENLMKLVTTKNTFQHFTLNDVQIKKIPTGRNINIFLLDDSSLNDYGYVCCTHFENQAEIDEFHNNLEIVHTYGQTVHKEIPENYMTGINEICVAMLKDDGRWYRAHCVSHDGDDMITIMFLDFGNVQKMHKSEVLPITNNLLYPIYANFCYIDGYKINEPNPEIAKVLLEKCLNCREILATGEPGYFLIKLDM